MQPPHSKRWLIGETIPPEISQALQDYPILLRQALYNRGYRNTESVNAYFDIGKPIYDPFLLKGMQPAVERLLYAIDHDQAMAIYGDYDVDGVTATVLMT